MTKMNSTHSSRFSAGLLVVVVLLAATGTAAAFSVSAEGVPFSSEVGSEVTVTYTISDPFTDAPNQWTLHGETELENVAWTVTVLRAGQPVENGQTTYGNQSFNQSLSVDNNGDEVRIRLTGTVPAIGNYTYEPREEYVVATLARRTGNNTQVFRNDTAYHYTPESRQARRAIDNASTAIESIGGDKKAESLLNRSISAYNAGNFENAVKLANQAKSRAESVQQSRQTTQLLLYGAGAIVVLAVVGAGIYYWRSQQDDYRQL